MIIFNYIFYLVKLIFVKYDRQKGSEFHPDLLFFISECDIEYISPSNYKPPELRDKGTNGTNGEGFDADDHYERLIRGSLKQLEKQKVSFTRILQFL